MSEAERGSQAQIPAVISIPASGSFTLSREFCFSAPTQHTVQSTFTGTDARGRAVSFAAPQVVLSAR